MIGVGSKIMFTSNSEYYGLSGVVISEAGDILQVNIDSSNCFVSVSRNEIKELEEDVKIYSEFSKDFIRVRKPEIDYLVELMYAMSKEYLHKYNANNQIYFDDIKIPETIISIFQNNRDIILDKSPQILKLFKKVYITNEDFVEGHSKEEKLGLGEMYDFIENFDTDKLFFEVLLFLHAKLYSKCPHPEFGGKYRDTNIYVVGADNIGVEDYQEVPAAMKNLYPLFNKIMELSKLDGTVDFNVFDYIDMVIELKCKIIKIHPFGDGNGRVSRGFVNLLFKKIGFPPIYVEFDEKSSYLYAMSEAVTSGDRRYISKFYYYKIYSSLMDLGLKSDTILKSEFDDCAKLSRKLV